jgi:glutathione S-transferase
MYAELEIPWNGPWCDATRNGNSAQDARSAGNWNGPGLQTEAERLLSPFDLALAHRPFLFDDQPIFSDFALFGVLGNLTYREYNSLPASLTKLAGWFERMRTFQYEPSAEN